jgi:nucleotide-binding universal stress UspA family protein
MKIVVGVDGSAPSRRAVEWCAAHAAALDAEVIVVHAIDSPVIVAPKAAMVPVHQLSPQNHEELEKIATELERPARKGVGSVPSCSGPATRPRDPCGRGPRRSLVVTDRRGRGGFTELLLGSTSHAVAHHPGSLLIVPTSRKRSSLKGAMALVYTDRTQGVGRSAHADDDRRHRCDRASTP